MTKKGAAVSGYPSVLWVQRAFQKGRRSTIVERHNEKAKEEEEKKEDKYWRMNGWYIQRHSKS